MTLDLNDYSKDVLMRYIVNSPAVIHGADRLKQDLDNIALDIEIERLQKRQKELLDQMDRNMGIEHHRQWERINRELDQVWKKLDEVSKKRFGRTSP
jgi:ABC-type phosphate transport system auxiliary subunit